METKNNPVDTEFRAVDFMHKVRSELTKKYLENKEQYMQDLKEAMSDFKLRQETAHSKQKNQQNFCSLQKICKNGFLITVSILLTECI